MRKYPWFARVRRGFARHVIEFKDKPILYVEIGCWKGDSAEWMLKNVLTDRGAWGIGIDPYAAMPKHTQQEMDEFYAVARKRLAEYMKTGLWRFVRLPSQTAFAAWGGHNKVDGLRLPQKPIDLLYIDGVHEGPGPLVDFCMAWPHLKPGSGVIFDDYDLGMKRPYSNVPDSVAAIQYVFGNMLQPWGEQNDKQRFFKVRTKDCDRGWRKDFGRRLNGAEQRDLATRIECWAK